MNNALLGERTLEATATSHSEPLPRTRRISSAMSAASTVMIIFARASTMSSHSRKTMQPAFRAQEIARRQLSLRSVGVAPGVTWLRSTARGTIAERGAKAERSRHEGGAMADPTPNDRGTQSVRIRRERGGSCLAVACQLPGLRLTELSKQGPFINRSRRLVLHRLS